MSWYLPGYKSGGPVRSIAGLVEKLGDEFEFRIITDDRDLGEDSRYSGVQPGQWHAVAKAHVLYVPKANPARILALVRATPHDVLYLNSFFSRPFSVIPMLAGSAGLLPDRPIVLAPRGEFSVGALALKRRRKHAFVTLARHLPAYHRVLWHASTEYEGEDIRRAFGKVTVLHTAAPLLQARNGGARILEVVTAPDLRASYPAAADPRRPATAKAAGELRAVFLSRVSRMKNLAGALRMLRDVKGRVRFDVFGPLEDRGYWRECEDLIAALPPQIEVRYCGPIAHHEVARTLAQYHLFFFPTHGENYGHVIVEALRSGCPVLLSDKTPWRDLAGEGAGWDLPLDQPALFREALQQAVDMGPGEHRTMSESARAFGQRRSDDPEVVAQNRKLFQRALLRGARLAAHGSPEPCPG